MPTTLVGKIGGSSCTSGSAQRSPVKETELHGKSVRAATTSASGAAPGSPSTTPNAVLPAGGAKLAMRTVRRLPRGDECSPARPAGRSAWRAHLGRGSPARDTGLVTGAEAGQDRERVRRRLVLVVGTLAGLLVLAGVLPWVTGGDSTIRFLALPMLLAGLMVSGAAIRIATVRRPTPVTPVERTCDGCSCGAGGWGG